MAKLPLNLPLFVAKFTLGERITSIESLKSILLFGFATKQRGPLSFNVSLVELASPNISGVQVWSFCKTLKTTLQVKQMYHLDDTVFRSSGTCADPSKIMNAFPSKACGCDKVQREII